MLPIGLLLYVVQVDSVRKCYLIVYGLTIWNQDFSCLLWVLVKVFGKKQCYFRCVRFMKCNEQLHDCLLLLRSPQHIFTMFIIETCFHKKEKNILYKKTIFEIVHIFFTGDRVLLLKIKLLNVLCKCLGAQYFYKTNVLVI